jgi:hypothetical protein
MVPHTRRVIRLGHGATGHGAAVIVAVGSGAGTLLATNLSMLPPCQPLAIRSAANPGFCHQHTAGTLLATNQSSDKVVTLRYTIFAKVTTVRGPSGILPNNPTLATQYYEREKQANAAAAAAAAARGGGKRPDGDTKDGGGGFRWKAKWAAYSARCLWCVTSSVWWQSYGGRFHTKCRTPG